MYQAKVYVTLKKSVLDPQGATVKQALQSLQFKSVDNVRLGKYVELRLKSKDKNQAAKDVKAMCEKLLINPVIEEYSYKIEKVS